jgi:outer membrane protein OmpA-like peptidoglycan-associated protein
MKSIKFIMAALVAVFVALGSTSVFAQEDGNRDANGYVVRGPYLTNGGGSNWFVGVGGGFGTSFGVDIKPFAQFNPANQWQAEAFVGKWFTPAIGVRAGYKGGMNQFVYDTDLYTANYASGEQVRFGYAHADVMWNLSDALSGYKQTRFWDIIPYAGAGYLGVNNGVTDNKFAVSGGLYNKFRLGEVVSLYLDVNLIATENPVGLTKIEDGAPVINNDTKVYARPLYMPSATIGVAFNISHKKNFDRFKSVGVYKADYDKLYNENGELRERVGNLEQQNEELKKNLKAASNKPAQVKEVVVEKTRVLVGSNIITFPIGSCVLSETERAKVEAFAKSLDADTLVQVMGSADSKTGTETRNFALAKNRANVVKNELVKNGVAEDRIAVASTLDATDNVATSRSAVVTLSVK